MRSLLASVITCAALLAGGAALLGRFGSHHFLPQQQMDDAARAGDGCILFLGDSRMVAAFDADALHQALRRAGGERCHAQLAIGATDIGGAYLAAREYLAHGRVPRAAVIGKVGDSLLVSGRARPEDMVGNNAIRLIWSRPEDVFADVPGFPTEDIGALDAGLRFVFARATPLGRYQSLISIRAQRLGAWLTGQAPGAQNRFGLLGDMESLEGTLRARAQAELAAAMRDDAPARRYGPWFERLTDLLRQHGVAPIVVELPMREAYRAAVTSTPAALAYQAWLAAELQRMGGELIDLARAPWLDDRLFADGLHVGPTGARLVSAEMGARLGAWLAAAPPDPGP